MINARLGKQFFTNEFKNSMKNTNFRFSLLHDIKKPTTFIKTHAKLYLFRQLCLT